MKEVILAIIGVIGMVLVALIENLRGRRKYAIDQARRDQKQEDLNKQILERLDEHNNYAKRFVSVDEKLTKMNNKIELVQNDMKYLKKGIHIDG